MHNEKRVGACTQLTPSFAISLSPLLIDYLSQASHFSWFLVLLVHLIVDTQRKVREKEREEGAKEGDKLQDGERERERAGRMRMLREEKRE